MSNVDPTPGLLRRASTFGTSNTVMVFITSTDDLYQDKLNEVITQEQKPLTVENLPRTPWQGSKDIYIPGPNSKHHDSKNPTSKTCSCCQYVATINVDQADRTLRYKRAFGSIKKLYVFESPLKTVP